MRNRIKPSNRKRSISNRKIANRCTVQVKVFVSERTKVHPTKHFASKCSTAERKESIKICSKYNNDTIVERMPMEHEKRNITQPLDNVEFPNNETIPTKNYQVNSNSQHTSNNFDLHTCNNIKPENKITSTADQTELNAAEKHNQKVKQDAEEAKNPNKYESYNYINSQFDRGLHLFVARKRGSNHVRKNMPCQDYCSILQGKKCIILTDADGVSSCDYSEIGSKIACSAVEKTVLSAEEHFSSEDQFVKQLQSIEFRERLVSCWVNLVMSEITNLSPSDQITQLSKYGSTVMFAVITHNWIVTGNLGDGQIIVFNDNFGFKLRPHPPKESSRVRCLVNETCARDDFIVAAYPRSEFNGVLLSSDGIYESIERGVVFYQYAKQLKERFFSCSPPEPLQPFCFKEPGEPLKDFSIYRTEDDCSISVAFDVLNQSVLFHELNEEIVSEYIEDVIPDRYGKECITFFGRRAQQTLLVTVSYTFQVLPKMLKSAKILSPVYRWDGKKFFYSVYSRDEFDTIEMLYCTGKLRVKKSDDESVSLYILNLFLKLKKLQKELNEFGYSLNDSAKHLITYDGDVLYIKPEACRRTLETNEELPLSIQNLFANMIGMLSCGDKKMPIFDSGYLRVGCKIARLGGNNKEQLCTVIREKKNYWLKNTGITKWTISDGSVVLPEQSILLEDNLTLSLNQDSNSPETYHFQFKNSI